MVIWGNGVPTKSAKTLGTLEISKRGVISLSVHSNDIQSWPITNIIVSVRRQE